jgi:hypothetical protein
MSNKKRFFGFQLFLHTEMNATATKSMQQSPSLEADSRSKSVEIPHLLGSPKIHYCGHKNRPEYLIETITLKYSITIYSKRVWSWTTLTLRSLVRIPPEAWMYVRVVLCR